MGEGGTTRERGFKVNERAREALVRAALDGHKQGRKSFHLQDGSDCAMGVLHIAQHGWNRSKAVVCRNRRGTDPWRKVEKWAGMTSKESAQVFTANDRGWDFLTIARKIGTPEYDEAVKLTQEDSK